MYQEERIQQMQQLLEKKKKTFQKRDNGSIPDFI